MDLFEAHADPRRAKSSREKLRCIVHYFERQARRLAAKGGEEALRRSPAPRPLKGLRRYSFGV
jgi:hypothetical protein